MAGLRVETASRLHFGLLGWGPEAPRQFGGLGLMVEEPGMEVAFEPAPGWSATGTLADRALEIARGVAAALKQEGHEIGPLTVDVKRSPEAHVGLGVGTQLSLSIARGLTELAGLPDTPVATLARLTGRGRRSGIGIHGFAEGGLILDAGRREESRIPAKLLRLDFPEDWRVVLVTPDGAAGLHGSSEARAFQNLPAISRGVTDRLCGLVLLSLLPAVVEHDFAAFGESLSEIQDVVGRCYVSAQGGAYASTEAGRLVERLREIGLSGVGQSSWGPTLYGFTDANDNECQALNNRLMDEIGLQHEQVRWTGARNCGAKVFWYENQRGLS